MGDQILDERDGLLAVSGSGQAGKWLVVFPAAVVFRGIDGFAQDGGRVEQGDGFRFPGETVLQAFVDFQAVVIPVTGVGEGEGEFLFRNIIDVMDVVTADVPEFDLMLAGDAGYFQKIEVFAEDDVPGVGTVDYKAPLQDFRVLCRKLVDFQ